MSNNPDAFRWANWRVRGDESTLAKTLENIDASPPPAWGTRVQVGNALVPRLETRRYRFFPEGPLSSPWYFQIEYWVGQELRAGGIVGNHGPVDWVDARSNAAMSELIRFLDTVIIPAATKAGATVYDPTQVELFLDELPFDLRHQFTKFDTKVRKVLPFEWKEAEAWDELVVAAYRSSATFDAERLVGWFGSRGWSEADAKELAERLFDGCRLLSHYRDTLVIV
jgi:hypothetical protein